MTVLFIHFQSGSSKARTGAAAGAGSGSGCGAGTVGTWQHWWQSQEICRYLVLLSNKMHAKCACRAHNICNMQKRISVILMDRGTGERHPSSCTNCWHMNEVGRLMKQLKMYTIYMKFICDFPIYFLWQCYLQIIYLFIFSRRVWHYTRTAFRFASNSNKSQRS